MKHLRKQSKVWNMNRFHIKILPVLILFLIPIFSEKGKVVNEIEQTNSSIDQIIQDEMIYGNLVGLAVSVVKDGKVIHQKSYGFTDLEKKTPFTNSTLFRWASISKVITAVGIHQLKEDNKLKLDDKVSDMVSNWATDGKKKDITIKQLLSHRSGIKHYKEYDRDIYKGVGTTAYIPSQSVNVFKKGSLQFDPGKGYQYSTFAYNLLGEVIHDVGGGWDNHINTRIKNKLGLSSLTYNSTKGIKGYDKLCDDILVNRNGSDVIWKVPGGGYLSNIVDLNKFMLGLMNGTLLKTTAGLWEDNINGDGKYSLGVKRVKKGSALFVEHGGAHADVRTKMIFNTSKKDGIVIAINGGGYANFTMNRIVDRIANSAGIYSWNRTLYPYHYSKNKNDTKEDVDDGEELNEPCKGENAAVWHADDNKDVILRRGYSHNAFGDEWQRLRTAGYVCVNFETYMLNNKQVWDGIFKKQSGAQAMWRNFESADFNKKWQEMSDQGYRLVDLETYMVGSKRMYAGLFLPGKGKYALFRGFSTADFGTKREELGKSGYKLIDIEVYYENGQQKWSGVWIEGKDGMLNRNYNTTDFQKLVETRKKEGWNIIDVETYMDGKTRKWTGIWEKSIKNQETLFGYKHDNLFSKKLNTNSENQMVLTDIERY